MPVKRVLAGTAAVALALAGWLAATLVLVLVSLEPAARSIFSAVLTERLPLVVLAWLAASALAFAVIRWLHERHVQTPLRLAEAAGVLLAADKGKTTPLELQGNAGTRALVERLNALARQRDDLRSTMAEQVSLSSQRLQQERNRLAALMSELRQSVVVCNLDGVVVLYNDQARQELRATATAGADLIAIGRSVYGALDRQLVAHALEQIRSRMIHGEASPSAQFVTSTVSGQLLRVHMAPVRIASGAPEEGDLGGFVLMLDNITHTFEQESLRDQLLHGLTEASRASLGNMQAAVDMLGYADIEPAMRERFLAVVRDELHAMSQRITDLAQRSASGLKTRWPMEDILGSDLLLAAQRKVTQGCDVAVTLEEVDGNCWLRVDSFRLIQAIASLSCRLVDEFGIRTLQLRLQKAGTRAHLDLVWTGQAMSTETVMGWELDPMRAGGDASALTVRDVIERHGGEFWFERERARHQALFRFLLPQAVAAEARETEGSRQLSSGDARPEYYDFDLFQVTGESSALEDRSLADLVYTVFDTETTGLDPSEGDEIIQIGAVRIVNRKLLQGECFEQLVNPGRVIPSASMAIHGITQDMVSGKPRIDRVLKAFHTFAEGSVLVAHNAAFDMKFLQLKEASCGVAFHQPVLDTLLLSAVVHPHQESHRLEEIAARLGIAVQGRHTALGDALVTAQVWLRLIALLQQAGIYTLGQAREAAQKTYFARVQY
ncbi:MAG: exonuclease domain-containing protein [Pseudomonadota bacterium]